MVLRGIDEASHKIHKSNIDEIKDNIDPIEEMMFQVINLSG